MWHLSAEVHEAEPQAFPRGATAAKGCLRKSSESLLCLPGRAYFAHFPVVCHLGLHLIPDFLCRLLGLQASLVLPIAPALGFGAAPKPSRPLNPSHVPFLAPAA